MKKQKTDQKSEQKIIDVQGQNQGRGVSSSFPTASATSQSNRKKRPLELFVGDGNTAGLSSLPGDGVPLPDDDIDMRFNQEKVGETPSELIAAPLNAAASANQLLPNLPDDDSDMQLMAYPSLEALFDSLSLNGGVSKVEAEPRVLTSNAIVSSFPAIETTLSTTKAPVLASSSSIPSSSSSSSSTSAPGTIVSSSPSIGATLSATKAAMQVSSSSSTSAFKPFNLNAGVSESKKVTSTPTSSAIISSFSTIGATFSATNNVPMLASSSASSTSAPTAIVSSSSTIGTVFKPTKPLMLDTSSSSSSAEAPQFNNMNLDKFLDDTLTFFSIVANKNEANNEKFVALIQSNYPTYIGEFNRKLVRFVRTYHEDPNIDSLKTILQKLSSAMAGQSSAPSFRPSAFKS